VKEEVQRLKKRQDLIYQERCYLRFVPVLEREGSLRTAKNEGRYGYLWFTSLEGKLLNDK
jgi:hypothetical protein